VKASQRISFLNEFSALRATLVFYESPKRLANTLGAMTDTFGAERAAAVCRELTKKFEETRRGTLGDLFNQYKAEPVPKGEIVIVIGPPPAHQVGEEDIEPLLREALETATLKDAVARVTEETGAPRKRVYSLALELTK
jgi:16S rRNA (cytidine1402-2'-O)-methyltransferase